MKIGSRRQAVRNSKKTKIFGFALCTLLYALCESAETQQSKKVPRIGFLEGASFAESQGIEPFRQGLRELGYVEGQNIIVEIRAMEGKPERIPDLIGALLSRKVDIIVTPVSAGARAAKKATPTIPIVVVVGDPLGSGLVASLARPGGNVTGLSAFAEVGGKRLEILKETIPSVNRVAVFWNPTNARSSFSSGTQKPQQKSCESSSNRLRFAIPTISTALSTLQLESAPAL